MMAGRRRRARKVKRRRKSKNFDGILDTFFFIIPLTPLKQSTLITRAIRKLLD